LKLCETVSDALGDALSNPVFDWSVAAAAAWTAEGATPPTLSLLKAALGKASAKSLPGLELLDPWEASLTGAEESSPVASPVESSVEPDAVTWVTDAIGDPESWPIAEAWESDEPDWKLDWTLGAGETWWLAKEVVLTLACCSTAATDSVLALAACSSAVRPCSSAGRVASCWPASNFKFLNELAESFVCADSDFPVSVWACWSVAGWELATASAWLVVGGRVVETTFEFESLCEVGFTWLGEVEESAESVLTVCTGTDGDADWLFTELVWLSVFEFAVAEPSVSALDAEASAMDEGWELPLFAVVPAWPVGAASVVGLAGEPAPEPDCPPDRTAACPDVWKPVRLAW
jgi:hypothetical protein